MQLQLIQLLSDGNFHSGEEIAAQFGVTRAAIWKIIEKIRSKGIEIESFPKKGYRIVSAVELLDKKLIQKQLQSLTKKSVPGIKIEVLDKVDSTNTYLQEKTNKKSGYIVTTEEQLAGKGRNGRKWFSPFGKNLYTSVYWQFTDNLPFFSALSLVVGTTIAHTINNYVSERLDKYNMKLANKVMVKWPNDLYYKNKKLGGILIDTTREAEGPINAIIGFGINIKKTSCPSTQTACVEDLINECLSLGQEVQISRNQLLGKIVDAVLSAVADFTTYDFKRFKKIWKELDFLHRKQVTLQLSDNTETNGIADGVDEFGGILITSGGKQQTIYSATKVNFE